MSVTIKALWYIEGHLHGDLSLEAIADSAGVSKFHLSRAFPVSAGHTISGYVRGRRLSEAARALARGAPDILTLALDLGYGSHEAFTRAFRQQFGVTPESVRAQARLEELKLLEPIRMDKPNTLAMAPPRVLSAPAMRIFGLSQRYACDSKAGMPSQWARFLPHLGTIQGQVGLEAYGVVYNHDEGGNIDYLCGVPVPEFPSHPAEFTKLTIPAQTYAVFEQRDHISTIASSWQYIWDQGLSASGHQAAEGPVLERYGEEFDGRTGLGGFELWVPVKG